MEKFITKVPVNSTARRVVSPGINYTPNKKIIQDHWENPPPKNEIIPFELKLFNNQRDMTGHRIGRLKVIGFHISLRWLVRCDCGRYETRKYRALNNPNNKDDRCNICRHLLWLQDSKNK